MCDGKAVFTHVYAGHVGSVHDQRVFRLSEINNFLRSPDEYFPNDTHLVADAAYKIDPHLMAHLMVQGQWSFDAVPKQF